MQIALTKKLATAMGIKPSAADASVNPLFCWTVNWINTFSDRKEDMIVMVNQATRFTVTIYGIRCNQLKNLESKLVAAIRHTLLAMHINAEILDEYFQRAGDVAYVSNHDRKMTAQINRQGLEAAFHIGRVVNESGGELKYEDTLGQVVSRRLVNYSASPDESYVPAEAMVKALSELTSKQAYKYRAFEILVTLDLEIYKATRRLIVPADMDFRELHAVLQTVFDWEDCHLYDFTIFGDKRSSVCARLVPDEESLSYHDDAILMEGIPLSAYLPKHKRILYTYDMGDNWEHEIELVRVIEEHDAESPYLLEASGQAPPEDVGGVGGFIDFRAILLDPKHPKHAEVKAWAGYWALELGEWGKRARAVR